MADSGALTAPPTPATFAADPGAFRLVARRLADGRGPIAIDTERASGIRYDDRAFLVQFHRRGAGTVLVAPEGYRDEVRDIISPVVNDCDWVLHAAVSDLPALSMLGMRPTRLFDTEVAARLLSFERANLAAVTRDTLGITLAKGHGAEDWSRRPLPQTWLDYAALDVEFLLDTAEVMVEMAEQRGLLHFIEQECDAIAAADAPRARTWRDLKGVSKLRTAEQRAVARHLWQVRDRIAKKKDQAVTRILPTALLIELASTLPSHPRELGDMAVRGHLRRPKGDRWIHEVARARRSDPRQWPEPAPRSDAAPTGSTWRRVDEDSWLRLQEVRERLHLQATATGVPDDALLSPRLTRQIVWEVCTLGSARSAQGIDDRLTQLGARAWQRELCTPVIAGALGLLY
ncbi:HRDC domain-containing protein [Corynebacterium uterequi]|uniref:Ribonuclease D n=1 Tax=Corynebacterium uterequi TaxID=1072256 RepID=A0A0G3HD17_9CORY|nr:HRDC domain-containing protein [Corynebacterium uterequi]AKK11256.1 ribonuclease D [Corynebacterium uterequi]